MRIGDIVIHLCKRLRRDDDSSLCGWSCSRTGSADCSSMRLLSPVARVFHYPGKSRKTASYARCFAQFGIRRPHRAKTRFLNQRDDFVKVSLRDAQFLAHGASPSFSASYVYLTATSSGFTLKECRNLIIPFVKS